MATRFYLPSTGVAPVSPAFDSLFEKTAEADRITMVTTKISSGFATKTCTENVSTDPYDVLNRQYVSEPIGAHDWTDPIFQVQIRCLESSGQANFQLQISFRVFSYDGTTERLDLGSQSISNEFDNRDLENRGLPRSVVWEPSSLNGDRIVIDIGIRAWNTKTDIYTATMDFGDNSGTDLPEDDTEQTQYNPWVEVDEDFAPYVPPSGYVPKIIMIT